MMPTRSTLPMLAVLVMVLLADTPRCAAQASDYPIGTFTPPPPRPLSTQDPPAPIVQQEQPSTQDPPAPIVQQELPSTQPEPPEPQGPQVWNASRYPATDFRNEVTPPMFALWPENLSYVKFEYFCEDGLKHKRRLQEFVYKEGEGFLITRPYFDVGLVDKHFTPYFQHWRFWQVDIKRITCVLRCEYSDLQRLYDYRLQRNVLAKGLGYGMAALAILQGAVIVVTALLLKGMQQQIRTWKPQTPWSDCICDWIHLLLLVVIGFAMMEAVGHSDFFRWRSMLFYNIAVTYTYLTFFSMISSFLHQCGHFMTRRSIADPVLPKNTTPAASAAAAAAAGAKSGLSEDWRYQRVFGQFGVLVLMAMYLIGVDDDEGQGMDSLGGIVVAAIVVACIWSAGVSGVVAFRSVRVICKCLLPNAWKWPAFFDSRTHAQPASPRVSPQPASNVSTATPVPQLSRTKTK